MSNNNVENAEPEDKEIEVIRAPETELDGYQESMEQTKWLAQNIDQIVEMQKKIFMGVLKLTVPGDFIVFSGGGKERAELGTAACERIARVGVNITNSNMVKEVGRDENGKEYYAYVATATATFRSRQLAVLSVASSRDKFFGKVDGKYKELSEVNEGDVRKAAFRGLMKEGVKALLGLRRLDPEELEKYGVKLTRPGGHSFKDKGEKADAAEVVMIEVSEVTKKTGSSNGKEWTLYKVIDAEGVAYATFDKKLAELAKTLIGKQASIQFTKTERGCNLDTIESAATPATPAEK